MRRLLLAATLSALAALPARAEVLALRCTITPTGGKAYSGYVWIDMQGLRAYERWYKPDLMGPPPVNGPFHAVVMPNELAITNSMSAKGALVFRINRDTGSGNVSGGYVFCTRSDVALPIKLPPLPARTQKH